MPSTQQIMPTNELLEHALVGLQHRKKVLTSSIDALKQQLSSRTEVAMTTTILEPVKRKRRMSKVGRLAVAAAQRKRWAKAKRGKR